MKQIFTTYIFSLFLILFVSCHVHHTTRNPQFQKKCPIHHESLIKTKVENKSGAWSSINFDPTKTPYPKLGISIGCVGVQYESVIKYCPKCGAGD